MDSSVRKKSSSSPILVSAFIFSPTKKDLLWISPFQIWYLNVNAVFECIWCKPAFNYGFSSSVSFTTLGFIWQVRGQFSELPHLRYSFWGIFSLGQFRNKKSLLQRFELNLVHLQSWWKLKIPQKQYLINDWSRIATLPN